MRLLLTFFLLSLGALSTTAQPTYFNNRLSVTPAFTLGGHVVPVHNGYWLAGQCNNTFTFARRALFLQFFDSLGQAAPVTKRWEQPNTDFYTGVADHALVATPDRGLALTGTVGDSAGRFFGRLWRFSAQGDTLWTRTYSARYDLLLANSCLTADGGFALVGIVDTALNSDRTDVLLLRTDSLGRERWRRTYHVRRTDYGYFINPTPDGGFLLSGFTTHWFGVPPPGQPYDSDALIIKVDSLGLKQWHTTLGGRYSDGAGPGLPTADGGYLVSGNWADSWVNSESQRRPALFWLDSAGQLLRRRSYGPARQGTGLYSLHALADGSYVAAGQSSDTANASPGYGFMTGIALKVCADGDSVWYRTYKKLTGGRSYNYLRDFRPTADGGFVGAGFLWVRPPDTGSNDAWFFKVDSAGYLQAGGVPPTVRCRLPTGLPETGATTPQVEIYPNPTLPDGRFTLEAPPGATAILTDALGRELWRKPHLAPRTSNLELPHAGLYLLRIFFADGRALTRKLVR